MSVSEFDVINRYFANQKVADDNIVVGIGDDAAVVSIPVEKQLVVSVDTLISGVHFPVQTSAVDIAWKALAVNLSDLAAMGASPAWFTLALSLPEINHNWLAAFSESLANVASAHHISLLGGDTTRGPLSITIQVAGHVASGQALLRSGASVGDQIFVTGSIGDAALGLHLLEQQSEELAETDHLKRDLVRRLNRPQPRIELGQALCGIASACIDISDGLFADLSHILKASAVGARLQQAQIPLSEAAQKLLSENPQLQSIIYNRGDDYELCFCVPPEKCDQLDAIAKQQYCRVSHIGEIVSGHDLQLFDAQNKPLDYSHDSYDHFMNKHE